MVRMTIRLYQLNERLNMILQTYRGFEDEETTNLMAKKIIERVDDVPRRYPCENKSAGYKLAQAITENDEDNKVFSVHVWTNYIEVLPHISYGIEFVAEIIVHGRPFSPVK